MTYPNDDDSLAAAVGEALAARGAKVAVAETTSGGLISARLLSVPGASRWFERGVVVYTGSARQDLLGIDLELMRTKGSVSREAVIDMAERLRNAARVEFVVAESGIAGPQGSRRSPKPVGSVVIAAIGPDGTVAEEHVFPGSRAQVMARISQRSLEMLLEALASD